MVAGVTVERAMVLAAGLGLRLRPVTDSVPKPLIEVAGGTLIDRILDHLAAAGVAAAVVNTHHLGGMIEAHLRGRRHPRVLLSPEAELLDTGGGVLNALDRLGRGPFFVVNSDVLWLEGPKSPLGRLAGAWDDARMDALLLLHAAAGAAGCDGDGDFFIDRHGIDRHGIDRHGTLRRRGAREAAPFLFAGVQMLHPRLFRAAPGATFSLNLLYDQAQAAGRLHGLVHDGAWFHVGTPAGLAAARARLDPPSRSPLRRAKEGGGGGRHAV